MLKLLGRARLRAPPPPPPVFCEPKCHGRRTTHVADAYDVQNQALAACWQRRKHGYHVPYHTTMRLTRACAWPTAAKTLPPAAHSAHETAECAMSQPLHLPPETFGATKDADIRHALCHRGKTFKIAVVNIQCYETETCCKQARRTSMVQNTSPLPHMRRPPYTIHCKCNANVTVPPVDYATPGASSPSPLPTR